MTRRLILIGVVVAVIGGLGFWAYDRYLGRELQQGEELRDALAGELAEAGFAFASMEYDWRSRRVVAEGLAATELPEGVTGFSVGRAEYRGAKPEAIRAALTAARDKTSEESDGNSAPTDLIADLVLFDVFIGLEGGAEYRQASLTLKKVGIGKPLARKSGTAAALNEPLLRAIDLARRFHIGLLEAKEARFWYPESEATFEQKLLRLEDYRAGKFSEFRVEGANLSVAVVFRTRLDEYFIQSVDAGNFLADFHKSPIFGLVSGLLGLKAPEEYGPPAETAIIMGDTAAIGFEMLIPGTGRIAFDEISSSDRQFINGIEVGNNSKIAALELQFNMLARMLTAGLDAVGVDLVSVTAGAGSQAEAWFAARAGNPAPEHGPLTAALQPEREGESSGGGPESPAESDPEPEGGATTPPDEGEETPAKPGEEGIEQGPAAPVPEVWSNEIKPPERKPGPDNEAIAEIIRKLGFDHMRINSESLSGFDSKTKTWELSKFVFDMQKFWKLGLKIRLNGMGALEDLGRVPMGAGGWWSGPKADAVGKRFLEEGRFESLSFTYREQGFISRLMSLIAEMQETTVEVLAANFVNSVFSGEPLLQAEGLADSVKAFLITPELFSLRLQPEEPVPFSALQTMNAEKAPLSEVASRLGLVLTFNDRSFTDFKKTVATGSDIESEQD